MRGIFTFSMVHCASGLPAGIADLPLFFENPEPVPLETASAMTDSSPGCIRRRALLLGVTLALAGASRSSRNIST